MDALTWIGRDLRYSVRSLLRDRGSVALAVLALSLGIGATTVIFSVVYSILIAAFPFPDSSRVVHFYVQSADRPQEGLSHWYPAPEFVQYRDQSQVFTRVLGGASLEVLYNIENTTYRVRGAIIDPQAFATLGVKPILGREMTDADGAPEAPPTFVMSDRLWNQGFNRDPSVIGMNLKLNGVMRTLIAIAPPRFALHNADVFFPTTITAASTDAAIGGGGTRPLQVWTYARLKPGVSEEQAAANIAVVAQDVARLFPDRYPKGALKASVSSLANVYTAESLKEMVWILTGAVLMLLLIACSNVASLLLARATARETELALRAGLGASRGRLIQQLLTESFVLAVAGTLFGGLFAYSGILCVQAAIPANALPAEMQIRMVGQALVATVGVTMLTTLLCGLAPALRAARGDLQGRLTGSGKGAGLRSGGGRLRMALVAVQVTLAIVLLVGAGLMMRTLLNLQQIDTGVVTDHVLVGRYSFPLNQRQTPAERVQFIQRVVANVAGARGVVAVSPSMGYPLQGGATSPLSIPGTTPKGKWSTMIELVGDGYFKAVGLPLVGGRALEPTDIEGVRKVAVVNRRFVQDFLEGADPVGRTVQFAAVDRGADPKQPPSLFEIVGVVGDSRNAGLENPTRPQAFLPYTTPGLAPGALVVRTSGDPLAMQNEVRRQIWAVDPGVALMNTLSLEQVLNNAALAAPKFGVGLLGTFAGVGLILAAIGVFSVMAYTVSLQTHEIGIRIALGAEPGGVMRMILWKGLRPIAAGIVLGVAASYWLSRLLANQIYGVTTTDPWTFAGVVVVLAAVAVVACLLPARRATKVDPLIALRSE